MHGRVKVRTSEEEKAKKEKERQEKLKIFKHVSQKIQQKRKQGELDKELLELTGKVLISNPDTYTLWNIRREILSIFREILTLLSASNDVHSSVSHFKPVKKNWSFGLSDILSDLHYTEVHKLWKNQDVEEELPQMYNAELQLTEHCLKINPKSYCAWHQREWVLLTRPDPDWQKELALCNTYLKLDERNFHTWDYRRFVVGQCKPPLKDEFDFTTEKLLDNFSNYSAWHYRSKMLVELHPDLEGGRPIADSHHKHELKMVQSAAFTDPDDTSAWFYQRWLLGAVKKTINLVVCTVTPTKATFAFSDYVSQDFVKSKTRLFRNNELVNGDWISCHENGVLWILKHKEIISEGLDIKVLYETDEGEKQTIPCIEHDVFTYIGKSEIDFQWKYSEPVVEELNKQLEACRQLLVLEPDNKWTLLTTTVFLHCIDAKQYHKEVVTNLHTLKIIDKLRAGYYDDLITKWNIEVQLYDDFSKISMDFKISFGDKITSLPHLQYYSYCRNVDLSHQNLTSNILPSLVVLSHCEKLCLVNNKIDSLKGFPVLPELQELNLADNERLKEKEVEQLKKKSNYNVIF